MIPKIIHYCWFGGNPLPESAEKCIASWKKYFPDYEVIRWDEENYDINSIPYISEAYSWNKYAFVSDYARFEILYRYGGLYFDTDVEVIKNFSDIISNGSFMGCEIDPSQHSHIKVAPGLVIGAEPGLPVFKAILDYYAGQSFIMEDGTINQETVVTKTTKVLLENGLKNEPGIQKAAGLTVYPREYFNPLNNNTGKLILTDNTRSIHWYSMSWMDKNQLLRSRITRVFHRLLGENCFSMLKHKD